jgi:hypothetical protein
MSHALVQQGAPGADAARVFGTDAEVRVTVREDGDIMGSMRHFVDDDASYLGWLAEHPAGYVINTGRNPSAAYLMLHRTNCGTISGIPARGSTFTGQYSKVVGGCDELEAFARGLDGQARPCGLCLRQPVAPDGGKYGPLRDYLAGLEGDDAQMSFAQIEELVGRLPESARAHRAWWSNGSHVEARAWRDAGWRVHSVDQAAGQVTFARSSASPSRRAGHSETLRQSPYIDPALAGAVAARARELGLDPAKLLRLITELNDNYQRGNAYAAHALLRAILDHIPPMLACADFTVVVSNHSWGHTDRKYVRRLLDFKLQADDALHRQMSRKPGQLGLDDMPPRIWVTRLLQECAG